MKKKAFALAAVFLLFAVSGGVLLASTNNDIINFCGGGAGYSTAILTDPDKIPILMIQPYSGTTLEDMSFELRLQNAYWDLEAFRQSEIENYGSLDPEGSFIPDVSQNGYLTSRQYPEGVKYKMEIGDANNVVIVTLDHFYPVTSYEAIYIPLLVEITGDRPSVEIYDPEWGGLSDEGYYYFSSSGRITTQARLTAAADFSQTTVIPDLSIRELAGNAFTSGVLTLTAPAGYQWINIEQIRLAGKNIGGAEITGRAYGGTGQNAEENRSELRLSLAVGSAAEGAIRTFILQNLQIEALFGNEEYGAVYLKLSGCNMEPETLRAANRIKADYTFSTAGAVIPKLSAGYNPADPASENIRALKVTFEEASPGLWRAGQRTTFTLPKGITARAVIVNTANLTADLPKDTLIRRVDENAFALNVPNGGIWTLAADGLTVQGAGVIGGRTAKVEMTFYIVTDESFRGPVYVSAGGAGLRYEASAAIADIVERTAAGAVVLKIGSFEMEAGGGIVTMDVAPYIEDGYTMVPVSYVARALGLPEGGVVWDGAARTVTIDTGVRVAVLTIGSDRMMIDGVVVEIAKAPVINEGRTFLPFRVLGEQVLGVVVGWDAEARTAIFY